MPENVLYYGDNLDILRRYIKDESVNLIYLDPPFKSNQDYNVLFAEKDGTQAAAQIKAFEDTWHWDMSAAEAYDDVMRQGGKVAQAMVAFRTFLGENDMLAYLAMMAPRLVEMRRALKPTGSLYLHCDSTASHYLKMLLDAVFSPINFRNEIVWQRTGAHNDARRFGRITDSIFFYSKSTSYTFNTQFTEYAPEYVAERYRYKDESGRLFWPNTMTAAGPGPARVFKGKEMVPPTGTHWRFSQSEIDRLEKEGKIYYSNGGKPYVKSFLDERKGRPCQNLWTDIVMSKSGSERLGYPTQKPEALLERIILASSIEGDVVMDPFCGCGTAVAVAQRLKRHWVGIDITHLAVNLIRRRLRDAFGPDILQTFKVIGEPVSVDDAKALAESDQYQFQWWALGLVGARPAEGKKGADKGIDGRIYFHDEPKGATKQIVLSVKAGKLQAAYVRDIRGVMDREKAEISVLISMGEPTKQMRTEAATAGFYESPYGKRYPRLQLLTVAELLAGKDIDYPPSSHKQDVTFKKAPKVKKESATGVLPFASRDE